VKRLCADDSAATSVKVGYRQASYSENPHQPERAQDRVQCRWGFFSSAAFCRTRFTAPGIVNT
jgi:hypothetical protein